MCTDVDGVQTDRGEQKVSAVGHDERPPVDIAAPAQVKQGAGNKNRKQETVIKSRELTANSYKTIPKPKLPPMTDPVIEAYKKDIDRTLISENLKISTQQRSEKFKRGMKLSFEMRGA